MAKTVIAAFRDYHEARAAIHNLVQGGFRLDEVSLLAADRTGVAEKTRRDDEVTSSAGAGAALGGAAGMVLGLAALAIPGIGPIVAAGPLAAGLASAGIGAAAGGIMGALATMGLQPDEAESLEQAVREGGSIVAVRAEGDRIDRAAGIFDRHGAAAVHRRHSAAVDEPAVRRSNDPHTQAQTYGDEGSPSEWGKAELNRSRGPKAETGRDDVRTYDPEQSIAPDISDPAIKQAYESHWAGKVRWEEFSDAYRYGYSLATGQRYGSSEWAEAEGDAKRRWEAEHGGTWGKLGSVIQHGWNHARGRS